MIGTDLVDKRRIAHAFAVHGARFASKILHPDELIELPEQKNPVRYLAMRWAAKEAFAKALGTGVRAPVLMPQIRIVHNRLGAPAFSYSDAIAEIVRQRGYTELLLSLSDEANYAIAFVIAK